MAVAHVICLNRSCVGSAFDGDSRSHIVYREYICIQTDPSSFIDEESGFSGGLKRCCRCKDWSGLVISIPDGYPGKVQDCSSHNFRERNIYENNHLLPPPAPFPFPAWLIIPSYHETSKRGVCSDPIPTRPYSSFGEFVETVTRLRAQWRLENRLIPLPPTFQVTRWMADRLEDGMWQKSSRMTSPLASSAISKQHSEPQGLSVEDRRFERLTRGFPLPWDHYR